MGVYYSAVILVIHGLEGCFLCYCYPEHGSSSDQDNRSSCQTCTKLTAFAWIPIVLWWRSDSSVPYGISVLRSQSPKHMTHARSSFGFQR
ncbi:MAG: hypothetical protein D4R77_01625 [Planctomycetaceae bacterium]|nr:MAG: hypothetical protein D4R77_01625 [Planctomycetaceae bacterium]